MVTLLSKDHHITEKPMMEFQPFGVEPDGTPIRDIAGLVTRANLEHLQDTVGRKHGEEASRLAVQKLLCRLNERIPDRAYHVTAEFLRNPWNSYSAEFQAYMGRFCLDISDDPLFHFGMGRDKAITLIVQVLGRPFSVPQIYRMSAYFSQRFARDLFYTEAVQVSEASAVLTMRFSDRALRQFGPYLRSCADMYCAGHKGYFTAVPEKFHARPPATVRDRRCLAEGDDACEWEVSWAAPRRRIWAVGDWLTGRRRDREAPARSPESPRLSVESASTPGQGRAPAAPPPRDMMPLLSKDHPITERPFMLFQPFGRESNGRMIRDQGGIVIKAAVEHLEDVMSRRGGPEAGRRAVQEHVRRLNERIPDPAFHVTEAFLKNPWNSYSSEFTAYNGQFTLDISGDRRFNFHMAREKAISHVIQVLGRPFSVAQIYKMSAYFSQRYAKDAYLVEAVTVADGRAVLRMTFSDRLCEQFGQYRRACAYLWCDAVKGYFTGVPERFHNLPPAQVTDHRCIVEGDDCCEWEVTWSERPRRSWLVPGRRTARPRGEDSPSRRVPPAAPARFPGPAEPSAASANVPGPPTVPAAAAPSPMRPLFSKDHPITERGMMEFQPFGTKPDGTPIRDFSGVVIRACLDYLEELAGRDAVEELVRSLNEHIPDRAYRVTADFLKSPWNSYAMEFSAFFAHLCVEISRNPLFHFTMARERAISPLIRALGRPFSVPQIYRMSPYFARRYYGEDVFFVDVVSLAGDSAVMRMRFGESTLRQFGPYLRSCAQHWCLGTRGYFIGVPEIYRGMPAAAAVDRRCIVEGDDYCEWEVTWTPQRGGGLFRGLATSAARRVLRPEIEQQQRLVEEQVQTLDSRHVELQEAFVQQQQLTVELQRRVDHLTTLHETGLAFTAILDREALINTVLDTFVHKLRYDRAMISFFDRTRRIVSDTRVLGVPAEIAEFARTMEVPVNDPESIEGTVLLKGEPVLVRDIQEAEVRMHPLHRQLAQAIRAKSAISVPLKVKNETLGALTVDRTGEQPLTQDDLNLIGTLATQVAIALDNTNAYRQIEELIAGLEAKVRERTAQLEQLNRELASANEQLTQMDRLKSQFLSHVSHELRTPLTSIKGFTENMLGGLAGALTDKQQTYLTRVVANTHRLIRMIAELLDQSRIEAGKIELVPTEVDLDRCIADAVEQLRPEALAKRQRLEVHGTDTVLTAWADADRLIQIVTNLVHNAVKFTPEGGEITVQVAREGPQAALVSVRDTGPGIPPDALPRIFDPFFRAGEERRTKSQGLGLGLSIVKTLVELHGGAVGVRSRPGQGTEFSFTVPLQPAGQPVRAAPGSDGKRILVVDDDPDIRQLLLDRLAADGYCMEATADGARALEALSARSFAGIILDIGMPDLDGLDVLRRIRATHPLLPVIMVTASGARERAIQAVSMGAQAYLLKPFDAEQLQEVVTRWFGPAAASDRAGAG